MQSRLTTQPERLRLAERTVEACATADVLRLRAESRHAARAAGLRYVEDSAPGIRRQRRGAGFSYSDVRGRPIRDPATLGRIRALAIPPAWQDVWICASAQGHIQATGRDARGRKQYRYHAQWSAAREADKHLRICEFARLLPQLRAHCLRRLRKPGLERETVLAALLRMVDLTAIRVGHEEYSRANDSFGLTTLRVRHARVRGSEVELKFRGKSGVPRHVVFRDSRLAKLVAACRGLRGKQLFQFVDDAGVARPVRAEDLNDYLHSLTTTRYSVKDFRTWSATVRAARELQAIGVATSQRATKKLVLEAIRRTAEHLGNTPAVCRKSYIHPGLLDAYIAGEPMPPEPPRGATGAAKHELTVLAFLERILEAKAKRTRSGRATLARAS
jgi:DNA topoisomerase I